MFWDYTNPKNLWEAEPTVMSGKHSIVETVHPLL
jgi:hypothetical protein